MWSYKPEPPGILFVEDLPKEVDECVLRSLFGDYRISYNGIVLKKHESLEKSYAFIIFETHEDSAKAKHDLNYTKLNGVPIRIYWYDPEARRIKDPETGTIIINGLEESIKELQLDEVFSNYGEIAFCKIPTDENGRSRGYGIIQFRYKEDAKKVLVDLQEASINGKKVTIEYYSTYKERTDYTTIFIKAEGEDAKLPYKNDEELSKVFEPFGEIQNVRLMLDENYGFCDFRLSEDAVSAFKGLNGIELDGVKITAYTPKEWEKHEEEYQEKIKDRKIFVKNFGLDVTEKEFEEFFKKFGEVENFKIARSPQEPFESKGFGFVLFNKAEDANKAIMETKAAELKGHKIIVTRFKTKEDLFNEWLLR